ncbi:MAG TPA: 16S rRNA (uracil(1498)-N(3))-methyltransferase [Firmicutes bacterium]|nr:16S rRNA (uracil(1498)-N(3))-methyltransferase [Bacillota bacterium]
MDSLARSARLFFSDDLSQGQRTVDITGVEFSHLRVLRPKAGDTVALTDGQGNMALGRINAVGKEHAAVDIIEKETIPPPQVHTALAFAPTKRDKWEWLVEKATENGVLSFIPLLTRRNIEFARDFERKRERFERIVRGAVKQSKRAWLPKIHAPVSLNKEIDFFEKFDTIALMHPHGQPLDALAFHGRKEIVIAVGPEGGWDDSEITAFRKHDALMFHLGPYILKTETAALKAAILIQYLSGGG